MHQSSVDITLGLSHDPVISGSPYRLPRSSPCPSTVPVYGTADISVAVVIIADFGQVWNSYNSYICHQSRPSESQLTTTEASIATCY